MAKGDKTKWTEAALTDLLRARYAGDSYAFLTQVPNGTSLNKTRTCDAIAMGLWKSKGIYLHGHEIKVSRSDWQREMQDPIKADEFARHCHYWWIVAAPGCVRVEELPSAWGLMEPAGGGLKVRKMGDRRSDAQPLPFEFLAGMLRKAQSQDTYEGELRRRWSEGYREGVQKGKADAESERTSWRRLGVGTDATADQLKQLRASVAAFEAASGVAINQWDGRKIGRAVRLVLQLGLDGAAANVKYLADQAERIVTQCRHALEVVEVAEPAAEERKAG